MIETILPQTIKASSFGENSMSGLDLLASIQILLVQDYDSQLKDLGKQIKGITNIKKAYRQELEKFRKALSQDTVKKGDKDTVEIPEELYEELSKSKEFLIDPQTQTVRENTIEKNALGYAGVVDGKEDYYNPDTGQNAQRSVIKAYFVEKNALDQRLETYKVKLESLNEQSELMSLGVQSQTNQRKIALESVSNLINKQHEGIATIVRNIKN